MASYVPNGRQQFLDANGVPLALGSVGMYVVGTLTPANTWQDSGKTTLNANPIPLDAGGFAMIYGSGQYRQIVKDEAGNDAFFVDGKAFSFGDQLSFQDMRGTELALTWLSASMKRWQ